MEQIKGGNWDEYDGYSKKIKKLLRIASNLLFGKN